MICDYGKIYRLGTKETHGVLSGMVWVQEKIDGAQFSFSKREGIVHFRSRNHPLMATDAGMFQEGVDAILERAGALLEGWVYRGEYLKKPKQNVLTYGRVPKGHVVIWEVDYQPHWPVVRTHITDDLDLELVPGMWISDPTQAELDELLAMPSMLGGPREGLVLKNPGFGVRAKYVSQAFREVQQRKKFNPQSRQPMLALAEQYTTELAEQYTTEARWRKAVQHLRERAELSSSAEDIGPLMEEVQRDIHLECEDEIKEKLYKIWRKTAAKALTRGLARWYLELLESELP